MDTNSKENEVLIDIERDEGSRGAHVERGPSFGGKKANVSLKRLVSGILSFNGSSEGEPGDKPYETKKLLVDRNTGEQGNVPLVEKEIENERRNGEKVKKAQKPPRPPKGPTLDAADMRLLKEITKIAKRKKERVERIKILKKMKAAKMLSSSPPSSPSSSSVASSGATISAIFITGFFFLIIIFQGLGSSTSSNVTLEGAPQSTPETTGLTPIEFYKAVMSDDGAAPNFLPPKSTI